MDCVAFFQILIRCVFVTTVCILPVIFWFNLNNSFVLIKSSVFKTHQLFDNKNHSCPIISPKLVGWIDLSLKATTAILNIDENIVELKLKQTGVQSGGRYEPKECQSRHKVAIIVPLRNRTDHLTVFLRYMHPFLQRQQLSYIIVVVEQSERSAFNRGMLMNIGFKEIQFLQEKYQCIILHDVDMLPEDDHNPYTCPEVGKPRQMAYSIDNWNNYKPTVASHFGGVTALTVTDFQRINGYSNSFWGWGGEDDQFYKRVRAENLTVTRAFDGQSTPLAHYKTQFHKGAVPNPDRLKVIREGWNRFKTDGLVDVKYKKLNLQFKPLYTHVIVDIQP